MTANDLASAKLHLRIIDTIYAEGEPLTRSELDRLPVTTIAGIAQRLLDTASDMAQDGRPVFDADQWSRAVTLAHWADYRDQPAGIALGGIS
jgi:hypothetical protein